MREAGVAFYGLGALFALYVVAASWRARDAGYRGPGGREAARLHTQTVERRVIHWWRARRRSRSMRS
jgi:hypothetical protein